MQHTKREGSPRQVNRPLALLTVGMCLFIISLFLLGGGHGGLRAKVDAAVACPVSPTAVVNTETNVPISGAYTIWSRVQATNVTDSYFLKIDNTCYKVTANNLPVSQWAWLAYENGVATNAMSQTLTAGNHSVAIYGDTSKLKVDRLMLVSGSCTPVDVGDNCANIVDAPPVVQLDSPAQNATLSTLTTIAATALDDGRVTKVEFLLDGTVIKTLTAPPYSMPWDPSTTTNGAHVIGVRATDNVGQSAVANAYTNVQIIAPPPGGGTPYAKIVIPSNNAFLQGDVGLDADVQNMTNPTVDFMVDGISIGRPMPTGYGWILMWNSRTVPNGAHTLKVRAVSGGTTVESPPLQISVLNVANIMLQPTQPGNLHTTSVRRYRASIEWSPSVDPTTPTIRYFIYLNGTYKNTQKGTTRTFINLTKDTPYEAKVIAVNAAGIQSQPASVVFRTKSVCVVSICY